MKKIFAALGIVTFAVVGCDDSSSASSNDDPGVESSSSEAVFSSSSSEQFFVPSEYRTCDKKYEGKFLLYQYRETLDAWYGTYRVNTVFYKCENGKWSGPSATSPENLTEGDVIRAAPDDWECDAENEGQVQSWRFMVFAVPHSPMGYTPTYYARCEQGDWVLCEPESSSSSSSADVQSSSSETESSSSSVSELSSSSLNDFDWSLPKETYLNPAIEYDSITDSRDGKVYKTVKIGNQVWMAENLNYDPGQGGSNGYKYNWSWCYNNDKKNCDVGGRLYTWAAAIDSVKLAKDADNPLECGDRKYCESLPARIRGICVEGWHLPSRDEWNELIMAVVDTANAGRIFKSQTGWIDGGNGTDSLGFSVLPVGYYHDKGKYYGDGSISRMWSSQSVSDLFATEMRIESNSNSVVLNFASGYKSFALSVRCLKD